MSPSSRAAHLERSAALAAALVAGCASMALELAAVRALAPWFGTSLAVWTNVLGVVLLALALGYAAGARLAARPEPLVWLGTLLLGAAFWSASLPWLVGSAAAALRPTELVLHEAAPLVPWASLAAALCAFLPPAALLGAAQPLALEVLARSSARGAGRAGGAILALSTLGSLVGVFATSYWLIPELGLRASFRCLAALIAAAGVFVLLIRRRSTRSAGATLCLLVGPIGVGAAAAVAPALRVPPPVGGLVELESRHSAYQFVRVAEDRSNQRRYFQVNEGADSYQSAYAPELGLLGEGYYYDFFALPAWWTDPRPRRWRVLVLGFGAGTVARVLSGATEEGIELEITGVEIDPVAVELGRTWMGLDEVEAGSRAKLRVIAGMDARAALAGLAGRYDLVVLDAYANQVEIPFHLCTREFFGELLPLLAPGAWVAANVGAFDFEDPVLVAVAETLASAWNTRVLALRVPTARNYALYARSGGLPPEPGSARWSAESSADGTPGTELGASIRALLAPLELPGAWRWFEAGARPLSDDRSPIELLQAVSLARAGQRLATRGKDG